MKISLAERRLAHLYEDLHVSPLFFDFLLKLNISSILVVRLKPRYNLKISISSLADQVQVWPIRCMVLFREGGGNLQIGGRTLPSLMMVSHWIYPVLQTNHRRCSYQGFESTNDVEYSRSLLFLALQESNPPRLISAIGIARFPQKVNKTLIKITRIQPEGNYGAYFDLELWKCGIQLLSNVQTAACSSGEEEKHKCFLAATSLT